MCSRQAQQWTSVSPCLVGINTAIVSPSGSSAGVSFAIPIDNVKVRRCRLKR